MAHTFLTGASNSNPPGSAAVERIPVEIWELCFRDSCPATFRRLSLVCRLFRTIFQPRVFQKLLFQFTPRLYNCDALTEWLFHHWKQDIKRILRTRKRIQLLIDEPRLAAAVQEWQANGKRVSPLEGDVDLLEAAVDKQQSAMLSAFQHSLPHFPNLKRLKLTNFDVDASCIDILASLPRHLHLELPSCSYPDSSQSIGSLRSVTYGRINDEECRNAMQLIDVDRLQKLSFEYITRGNAVKLYQELLSCGRFSSLKHLTIPLSPDIRFPHSKYIILASIFANCPLLQSLKITNRDRGRRHISPDELQPLPIQPLVAPSLEELDCPVPWAQSLVPGRPIKTLMVDTFPSMLVNNVHEVMDILKSLSTSSVAVTTLGLPALGTPGPVLELVRDFFPFLQILYIVILDNTSKRRRKRVGGGFSGHDCSPLSFDFDLDLLINEEVIVHTLCSLEDEVDAQLSSFMPEADGTSNTSSKDSESTVTQDPIDVDFVLPDVPLNEFGRPVKPPTGYLNVLTHLARGYYQFPKSLRKLDMQSLCGTRGCFVPSVSGAAYRALLPEFSKHYPQLDDVSFEAGRPTRWRKTGGQWLQVSIS